MVPKHIPESSIELPRPSAQRELELVVRPPAEIIRPEHDVLERTLDVDHGDPLADPRFVHHLRRMSPDLEVVRAHEVLGDSLAEDRVDELAEVFGRAGRRNGSLAALCPDQPGHALVRRLLGQIADVVLERVRHPRVEHPHPRLAVVERELVAHEPLEALVVVGVVAEHHVPADVPSEPLRIDERVGQPPDVPVAIEHLEVRVSQLFEPVRAPKPRWTGTDDDDFGVVRHAANARLGFRRWGGRVRWGVIRGPAVRPTHSGGEE